MLQNFIGKRAVASVVDVGKTPMGKIMLKVIFEDGTYQYMPEKRFNIIKTDKPTDDSYIRGMIVTYASREVGAAAYSMLLEFGCRLSEIEPVLNQTIALTNAGAEKVNNLLWSVDYADERTLNQINDILTKNITENNNGAESKGAESNSPDTK